MIAARDALRLKTKVLGVVAENAPSYALSFSKGSPVSTNSANILADGLACRVPNSRTVEIINKGADRIVTIYEKRSRMPWAAISQIPIIYRWEHGRRLLPHS